MMKRKTTERGSRIEPSEEAKGRPWKQNDRRSVVSTCEMGFEVEGNEGNTYMSNEGGKRLCKTRAGSDRGGCNGLIDGGSMEIGWERRCDGVESGRSRA